MAGAGAGYNAPDIDSIVSELAKNYMRVIAQAADLRKWFDRIGDGSDESAAAALAEKSGMDADKALKTVQAVREMSYHASLFAPTHTLDVRGPSSLLNR
jgi:hypothetical protein